MPYSVVRAPNTPTHTHERARGVWRHRSMGVALRQRQLVVLRHVEPASSLAETRRHQLAGGVQRLRLLDGCAQTSVHLYQVNARQFTWNQRTHHNTPVCHKSKFVKTKHEGKRLYQTNRWGRAPQLWTSPPASSGRPALQQTSNIYVLIGIFLYE